MSAEPILELQNVYSSYGRIKALKGISIKVFPGEIVAMIGANGAGKSTTLMAICGVVPVEKGEILYNGQPIHGIAAEKLPPMGLVQVPEGRRIFPRLTLEENLEIGAFYRKNRSEIDRDLERVYDLFPILKERRRQQGGNLSGGDQQMLAVARALMTRPKALLLDEPSLGLAPLIVQKIFDIIATINKEEGTTILLVEQNANMALQAAQRGYVLETGTIKMEDEAGALLHNPEIRKAYLGE